MLYSLKIAVLSTLCALVLGVTASEGLTRCEFRGKGLLQQLFQLPMIIPVIVTAIALYKFETETAIRGSTVGLVSNLRYCQEDYLLLQHNLMSL